MLQAEEICITRDDRSLLGDLLLADPHRPTLLGTLVQITLQLAFELGGAAYRGNAHPRPRSVDISETLSSKKPNGPDQFVEGERLGNHGVRSRSVERRRVGRTGQKSDAEAWVIATDLPEQRDPALVAEVKVEQDGTDVVDGEAFPRLCQGARFADLPALQLEIDAAEKTDRRVVVDDEHGVTG